MKIVLAFDSFKGTLSSKEVSKIVKEGLIRKRSDLNIVSLEIGDGGEGTVDAIINQIGGKKRYKAITGPHFEKIQAFIGIKDDTCFIESASVVGFKYKRENDTPSCISSYGIGELIKYALSLNMKRIYLCLGGTISNDGGAGMACALGVKFFNKNGESFIPMGKSLCDVRDIDLSSTDKRIFDTEIIALSDVNNPLYGKNGASYVYAPQKGASDDEVVLLDKGLINISSILNEKYKLNLKNKSGAGAAGGLGYGALVFLKASIQKGIKTILDLLKFNDIIKDADIIFTGEGKLDVQSFKGKVVEGIVDEARSQKKKLIGIFGTIDYTDLIIPDDFIKVYETNYRHLDFSLVRGHAKKDLKEIVKNIII